jgi:hypothetical protein
MHALVDKVQQRVEVRGSDQCGMHRAQVRLGDVFERDRDVVYREVVVRLLLYIRLQSSVRPAPSRVEELEPARDEP